MPNVDWFIGRRLLAKRILFFEAMTMQITRRKILIAYVVGIIGVLISLSAMSQDLGVRGPTYPISEPDLLVEITATLKAKQKSGELDQLSSQMKTRAVDSVKNPRPLMLSATTKPTTRYFDPTVEVIEPIRDPAGRIIVAAGTRKNPLDVVSMTRQLMFFDARDPRQVQFAKQVVDRLGLGVKPILTGGSYLELMKIWKTPVFYDQQGALTSQLGIYHVPAIVRQEGKLLRIDEMSVQ
jgi:conjugal transfer pilus assembly protein TraW